MKKLFLICFLVFLFSGFLGVQARDTKFAVVSDAKLSLSRNKDGAWDMTKTIHYLQETVKEINKTDVDFVVFLGDATSGVDKTSIVMFAKVINKLKKPYYVGLGDRDVAQVSGVDKKEFYHLVNMFSRNKIRHLPYIKRGNNGLVFIFMDGVNEFIPGTKGFFKEKELLWLDKKLKKNKNKSVVIFQHFPLVEPYSNSTYKTYNSEEYLKLLNEHKNVISIISGHYGADSEISEEGIKHISTPALYEKGEYSQIEIEKNSFNNKYIIKTKILDIE